MQFVRFTLQTLGISLFIIFSCQSVSAQSQEDPVYEEGIICEKEDITAGTPIEPRCWLILDPKPALPDDPDKVLEELLLYLLTILR